MSDIHPSARLALTDGSVFTAKAFGRTSGEMIEGEVCFNTSMTGYQEILTDPSYAGQIVTMTCPQIGNYGTNPADFESRQVFVKGFIVRELSQLVSNYRATLALEAWLDEQNVIGLTGLDTRALTRKLRIAGALDGVVSTNPDISDQELVARARAAQGLVGVDWVGRVTNRTTAAWQEGLGNWAPLQGRVNPPASRQPIVAIDCGMKWNILRNLVEAGCDLDIVPYDEPAEAILARKPAGVFVSNGPGDPAAVTPTINSLQAMLGKVPIFGICLGHQLLSLALGAQTFKLKFGHRGGNQPVQNLQTRKVEITSQNHGFAVDLKSLDAAGAEPTHINLNDQTLEGFRHRDMPIFAVQYHPEAGPGPHDSRYLFDCFLSMIETGQSPTAEQMDSAQRKRNNPTNQATTA